MPSTYAHYRLGQEVLDNLSGGIKSTILNHKQLYDIGLHGPDILFYYKPLFSCEVNNRDMTCMPEAADSFLKMRLMC